MSGRRASRARRGPDEVARLAPVVTELIRFATGPDLETRWAARLLLTRLLTEGVLGDDDSGVARAVMGVNA